MLTLWQQWPISHNVCGTLSLRTLAVRERRRDALAEGTKLDLAVAGFAGVVVDLYSESRNPFTHASLLDPSVWLMRQIPRENRGLSPDPIDPSQLRELSYHATYYDQNRTPYNDHPLSSRQTNGVLIGGSIGHLRGARLLIVYQHIKQ